MAVRFHVGRPGTLSWPVEVIVLIIASCAQASFSAAIACGGEN